MAAKRTGILVTALLLAACSKATEPAATEAKVTDERWIEAFPAYPGARKLCWQHVSGVNMHILWTAYATPDAKAKVIAFYEEHRGSLEIDREHGFDLRAPGDRVLSVHAKDETYPRCDVPPAASDATVIIVSRAAR